MGEESVRHLRGQRLGARFLGEASRARAGRAPQGALVVLLVLAAASGVLAAPDNRAIQTIITSPTNQFDNQAGGSVNIQVDVTGGAVANENPDAQGGYRLEVYDGSGNLVKRLASLEINADPTGAINWNGNDDDSGLLPYGSYTLRAYTSMRDPAFQVKVQGSGITIDRPGDMHVTANGVLSWTNGGTRLSFCQVSLGNPNVEDATFLRLVDYTNDRNITSGVTNTDRQYGIVMNSNNEVFITHNHQGCCVDEGVVAKYDIATETWSAYRWAEDNPHFSLDVDELIGLGIDAKDSIYVAFVSTVVGGGNGGNAEGVSRFRDNGLSGTEVNTNDFNRDHFDVAPRPDGNGPVFGLNRDDGRIVKYNNNLTVATAVWVAHSTAWADGSIAVTSDECVYVTDENNDRFRKYCDLNGDGDGSDPGELIYQVSTASQSPNGMLDQARGLTVWEKTSTNETFVIVGSSSRNQISIWKEISGGDSASFVRLIKDDPNNLNDPEGIGINKDSGVVVLSNGQRSVKLFDKSGVFVKLTDAPNGEFIQGNDNTTDLSDSTGFKQPRALTVDDTGNIYVFDQNDYTNLTEIALKKFSPTGKPLGVIQHFEDCFGAGIFNQAVVQAVWGNNSIYAVTKEDGARVMRINPDGLIMAHLGGRSMTNSACLAPGADLAAEGNTNLDALGVYVGPFYDAGAGVVWETAVYVLTQNEEIEVWSDDLSTRFTFVAPQSPALDALGSYVNGFLVDEHGEVYVFDGSAGDPDFYKYNAASPSAPLAANGLLQVDFPVGSANGQVRSPRQILWEDNKGVYKKNPVTGRYEANFWLVDQGNDRLQKFTLAWEDVEETPIVLAESQDTPIVVSATITGETVTTIGGIYYVGVQDSIVIQINFAASDGMDANTQPIVQIKPNGGSFQAVNQTSYPDGGTTWSGTVAITPTMNEGDAQIRVEEAYDKAGAVRLIDPNPDQTDFDPNDDFKHFVIDHSGPAMSVSKPPSGGDQTAQATYQVTGQVTNEATGLDATILIEVWTDSTGGTVFDSLTVTASQTDGSFAGIVDLKGPPPTDNWIEVTAIDKLGNRTVLSPRRKVARVKNVGNAFIDPSSEIQVGTLRRYEIRYTAAQQLSGDTLYFVIPDSWSAPQKTAPTSNGYVTVTTGGSYADSTITGDTIQIGGVTLSIGQTLSIFYGDSVSSLNGRAKPDLDASLADADNTFKVFLRQAGSDTLDPVPATTGKTLTVPVSDSPAGFAIFETGPRGASSVEFPKGSETEVLVVRSFNTNLGNHTNRVTQVVLSVESNTGAAVAWSAVASRVVVKNTSEGITFADVTSMPGGQVLTITLSGFTVSKGASRDMEFHVTASPTATADTVRFFFSGITDFTAVDHASGKALTEVEQETGVGKKTGLYDLVGRAPADTLSLGSDTSFTPVEVAAGQVDVSIMDLLFANDPPGAETPVNDVRVEELKLTVFDTNGNPIQASHVFRGVHLRDKATGTQYGGLDTPSVPNSETMTFALSGLTVSSGGTVTVRVWVDVVKETVSVSTFRIALENTGVVKAKDAVRQSSPATIRDAPSRAEVLPYRSKGVKIVPVAEGTLERITLLRADSTVINGAGGDQILTGEQIYVALRYRATAGRSALRVIPSDTDLRFFIGGVDKTSEFTVTKPPAKTVAAGSSDTFEYSVIQNLGSTTGELRVVVADTAGPDTRPRLYDNHDYFDPDRLRALLVLPTPSETVVVTSATIEAFAMTLGDQVANPGETAVPAVKFFVKNNAGSARQVDSVVLEAISEGNATVLARLYHDNGNGALDPSQDTLVASGALTANDTVLFTLSPKVSIGPSGETEIFFGAFDYDTTQTDGETVDARIPAGGVRVTGETAAPSTEINSSGKTTVEVVASRLTLTPDTQIVAVGSFPTATLKAVDRYGNVDAVTNVEASTQGHNLQVDVTIADSTPGAGETRYHITSTTGMNNVTPTPGIGVQSINGNLSQGQGTVEFHDTGAETISITLASVLSDSSGEIEFARLTSASAVSISADSAAPGETAFLVLAFRVTNRSGGAVTVDTVGVRSRNAADTEVAAVILFRDDNGNGAIDSGTDAVLGTGSFSGGFVTFDVSQAVADGDSVLFLVGYDVVTSVTDEHLIDAQADTVALSTGENLAGSPLNSSVDRRIDVVATHIAIDPNSGSTGTGENITVTARAVDDFLNKDVGYTGGTGLEFTLSGSAIWVTTTLANEDIDPPPDPPTENNKVRGNLVNGEANLTFTDNVEETVTLTVTISPGLPTGTAVNETGSYRFTQGITVTALPQGFATVSPGDTNRVILRFKVSASGTSDSVVKVIVTWVGTSTADVTNVRLYSDANGNDAFDAGTDDLFGAGPVSFAGDTATFEGETVFVANGTSKAFFFVVDVDLGAADGDTLDAEIRPDSITTEKGTPNVPDVVKNSTGHETIVGPLAVSAVALPGGTVPPGTANVEIGRFAVTVPLGLGSKVLTQVRLANAGTHPDTGLSNIRLYTDANGNDALDIGTDTLYATAAAGFTGGVVSFTGQETFPQGKTTRFFVVADLSETLAVDSRSLLVRLDVGACTFASGETRPTSTQTPSSPTFVKVVLSSNADSVEVVGSEALADGVDTAVVSVSVVDSAGVPATGRSVTLVLLDAGPTIVSANPVKTGDSGVVLFYLTSATAGAFRCTATVDGVGKADVGVVSFIDPFGAVLVANGNETRAQSGSGAWTGNPAFGRVVRDKYYYMSGQASPSAYKIASVLLDGGGAADILNQALGSTSLTSPAPDFLGNLRVEDVDGDSTQEVVFTGVWDEGNWLAQIYSIELDGGGLTRVSPNDWRDTDGQGTLHHTDRSWRTFDVDPTGDTIWVGFDGSLVSFSKQSGATFNPATDSKPVLLWTSIDDPESTFVFGAGRGGVWIQDPEVSPDGKRIAFTLLYLADNFSACGGGGRSDSAEIWVIKDLGTITPGSPADNLNPFVPSSVTSLSDSHLVQITDKETYRFAWKPHWSKDGSVLTFSVDTTGAFVLDDWVCDHPWNSNAFAGSDFDVYMTFYDEVNETAPNRPAKFAFEGNSIDELAGEFDRLGDSFAYVRTPNNNLWQARVGFLSGEATVTASGGVLFDSGRIVAFVPSGETLAAGAKIASRVPKTTPPAGTDSRLVITGAAKEFFSPDNPDTHVFFSETVTVVIHYSVEDFASDELVGFDSDGDGIPDRTEANLNVYYWDDAASKWVAFETTRDPNDNKLIFQTTHFSIYAGGLFRGATLGGSVHDVVAYPNPWRIDGVGSPTATLAPGSELYGIKFDRLPAGENRIAIYTIAGQKVLEGTIDAGGPAGTTAANGHLRFVGPGRVSWDLRNQHGREVASGVYIVTITGQGGTAIRKVAVIR